jgi:2-iminobutanoate/2-iminopropanoate deaminase
MRQAISTPAAPKAVGPYSQAVRAGDLLFVSGQIPLDPATGALVAGDIAAQTRRVMLSLEGILKAAGARFDDVVRATVFLANIDDFPAMNEVYGEFFSIPAPARSTIEASRLPRGAKLEIDLIAVLPK